MTLKTGSRLGPYEIVTLIGAGGMGEVYRGRDTRLDRTVAIKVVAGGLPTPQQRERFQREARAISALSHPHICTLYDVGHEAGTDYIIMEHLEGASLGERLARGPLPLDEALRYGIEIASALDKAHRQGIIHRDLKPANVMITKSGAKLLDFGLAKSIEPESISVGTSAPTRHGPMTAEGTVVGTLAYMAPEQLKGEPVDGRTDIFAFGALLYEMITGRRAFDAPSRISLIAAILEKEPPPITTQEPMSPAALDGLVRICLAKDLEQRFQSAHDVELQLGWIARERSGPGIARPGVKRTRRQLLPWSIAAVCATIAAGAGLFAWKEHRPTLMHPLRRVGLTVPATARIDNDQPEAFAVSADGSMIAYVAKTETGTQLFVVRFDGRDPKPIPGTEGATSPFFSPDGEWVAFGSEGKLKKVPVAGGLVATICDAPLLRGGAWRADGTIVFAPEPIQALSRVSADGGTPVALTHLDSSKGERGHKLPDFLPGGKEVLFTVAGADTSWVEAVSLENGRRTRVADAIRGRYDGRGHLVIAVNHTIRAVAFDPLTLRTSGPSVPIVDDVKSIPQFGYSEFAVLPDGALVYLHAGGDTPSRLVSVDRNGAATPLTPAARSFNTARYSPDGRRFITNDVKGWVSDLWLFDVARGSSMRITDDGESANPIWSADGTEVIFTCGPAWRADVCTMTIDKSGERRRLTSNSGQWFIPFPWAASPDGQHVLFGILDSRRDWDLWTIKLGPRPEARPFLATPHAEGFATLSPDGHWIAYNSDASGQSEIIVQPFPTLGSRTQISSGGGIAPVWGRRGDEIFFVNGKKMMVAKVRTKPAFWSDIPRVLFTAGRELVVRFDVAPDGQHFLFIEDTSPTEAVSQFSVVEGVAEYVRSRLGTKRSMSK